MEAQGLWETGVMEASENTGLTLEGLCRQVHAGCVWRPWVTGKGKGLPAGRGAPGDVHGVKGRISLAELIG